MTHRTTIQLIPAKTGDPTAVVTMDDGQTIYLHSRYNPIQEANLLVQSWDLPVEGPVLVYGLGCGYHLQVLLKRLKKTQNLIVFECNGELANVVISSGLFVHLLEDPRVELHVYSTLESFLPCFQAYVKMASEGIGAFFIHPPSVKIIPKHLGQIKELLEEYRVRIFSIQNRRELLDSNLKLVKDLLLKKPNIGIAKNHFLHVPAILVAAGPSLHEAIPLLQQLKGRALIICVGTALTPLLQQGVQPDLVVVIEGDPSVLAQFPEKECTIPLIAFPTACPELTLHYKGPVMWAYPEGVEELVQLAEDNGFLTIASGGSVATAALSILALLGCEPIVFVGQDLAYVNGKSHAHGTMHGSLHINEDDRPFGLSVEAVGGGMLHTNRGWNIFRRWIEAFIREHNSIQFYNASQGARIAGTIEQPLEELVLHPLFAKQHDITKRVNELFDFSNEWKAFLK